MPKTLRHLAALSTIALVALVCILGVATRTHAQTLLTGTIAGTITDAAGNRLSGVQIHIVDTRQYDVTNANGYFVITDVLPGTHTVEASLVGYQPVQAVNVVVTQELTTTVNLQLTQRAETQLGTTTVVAPLIRKNVTPTLYTVTSKEEQLVRSEPNNLYQYPGAMVSQPGIVPDADGYPSVRGSRIDEVGYMVDGILIVEPSTGGFATNLITVGMDRMNVYTGGYRAELGSAIGGVVNAVIKSGASMRGTAAVEANLGSWDYMGLVYEQGDVEDNGLSWYVAGNFFRTKFEKNRQLQELPASADAVVKLIQPFGDKDRVTLFYTGGFERYQFPLKDPFTGEPWGGDMLARHNYIFNDKTGAYELVNPEQDYADQMHHIGSLTWSHSFSPATRVALQTYAWDRRSDDHELSEWSGFDYKGRDKIYAGRLDWSTDMSERFQLRLGGEMIRGSNFNRVVLYGIPEYPLPPMRYVHDANTTDLNGYVSATVKPADRLTVDLGLRYDSRKYTRAITPGDIALGREDYAAADMDVLDRTGDKPRYDKVTPRAGVNFSLNPRTLLKASGGRFLQFAPGDMIERIYLPTAPYGSDVESTSYAAIRRKVFDVKPEYVDGFDVGIEQQLTRNLGFALTPYWRKTKDMFDYGIVYDEDGNRLPGGAWSNLAKGKTFGVETKLIARERKGLSGWITYTYQDAKATTTGSMSGSGLATPDRPDKLHRLDYDQRHTIYVVGQYQKGDFEVNPMLELGSGYPYGNSVQYDVDPSDPDGERLIPVLVNGRLASSDVNTYNTGWHENLSLTFRLYTDKKKSSYYFLQIQNILNNKDTTARSYYDPSTGSNAYGYVKGPVTYIDDEGATQVSENGALEYRTITRTPPVFVMVGLRKTF